MQHEVRLGLIYGLSAYLIWGLFPWYFHWLKAVEPLQILIHRVIWSFVLMLVVIAILHRWQAVRTVLAQPRQLVGLFVSACLIAANWLIFIWAVAQGRVVESSLGYFLTPLVSVLLAWLFLGERLDAYRIIACVLAALGVSWLIFQVGHLPWISLSLAASFGCYGLVRKQLNGDSLTGLAIESGLLFPLALAAWIGLEQQGTSQFLSEGSTITLLLVLSGAVTAAPLLLFASGARRLSLTAIGFLMYINPSMQFLTAVYLFKEPFNSHQLIAFACIWLGLGVFSWGATLRHAKGASS